MKITVEVVPGYEELFTVLIEALNQAQCGKGKKCHANKSDIPFTEQSIITEGKVLGLGGHVFQVRKKVLEAMNCENTERAIEDLLGAIVYTAAMKIIMEINLNKLPPITHGIYKPTCLTFSASPILKKENHNEK